MKYQTTKYQVTEEDRPLQLIKLAVAILLLLAIVGLLLAAFWFVVRPPLLLYPHPGDQLPDNRLTVSGSAVRGSQIEVLIDGQSRGTTPVNQDGGWSLTTDVHDLGEHWVHSQILNRFGVVMAASAPVRFFRVTPPPPVVPTPAPSAVPTMTTGEMTGAIIISNTVAPSIVVQVGPVQTTTSCGDPCAPPPTPTPTPTPCRPDPPPPAACTGSGRTYRVAPGDSLSRIAVRFGVTMRALLAVNPQITNPNFLRAGQVITIPGR